MNREHTSHVQQHQVKIRSHCSLQPLVVFRCLQWIRCGLHSAWKAVNKIQGLLFLHLKFRLWNLSAEEHSFRMASAQDSCVALCHRNMQVMCNHIEHFNTFHAAHPQHPQMFYSFPCITSFCHQATCLASALSAGRTSSCFAA